MRLEEIGQRITEARLRQGMKQYQLAEKIGVTPQTINRYEKGKMEAPTSTLEKIASLLKVRVGWLITGDQSAAPPMPSAPATEGNAHLVDKQTKYIAGLIKSHNSMHLNMMVDQIVRILDEGNAKKVSAVRKLLEVMDPLVRDGE